MIIIIAKLKLFKGYLKRKTPFHSGYRPTFEFIEESRVSGQISLLSNLKRMFPGDEQEVEIKFLNDKFLGENFGVGTTFKFYEGQEPLGEGIVIKIE